MANIIREERYIKADFANNNNKAWYIRVLDTNPIIVETEFGRVGSNFQKSTKQFNSQQEAINFLEKKCSEKERDGRNGEIAYRKLKTVEGTGGPSPKVVETSNLAQIAKEDIKFNSPEVEKLIVRLTNANVHNIVANTNITYNKGSGLFETPCGIVTKDGINEARKLLADIGVFVQNNDLRTDKYGQMLNEYLMIVPQDVGRKLDPTTLYTSMNDIYKQNDILDSLEVSFQKVSTQPNDDNKNNGETKRERIFNTQLNLVEDGKVIDRIIKKYNDTKSGMHVSSSLKVKRVYEVTIDNMKKNFHEKASSLSNIMELWHGTRCSNLLSIIRSGLCIVPATASHVCGRMWGRGLYFASSSTKSLNYSTGGVWHNSSYDSNCFMFLADVAMGEVYYPKRGESWNYELPKGYNSTWATVKNTGLHHDEMIIPNDFQCNLRYLVEFGR